MGCRRGFITLAAFFQPTVKAQIMEIGVISVLLPEKQRQRITTVKHGIVEGHRMVNGIVYVKGDRKQLETASRMFKRDYAGRVFDGAHSLEACQRAAAQQDEAEAERKRVAAVNAPQEPGPIGVGEFVEGLDARISSEHPVDPAGGEALEGSEDEEDAES